MKFKEKTCCVCGTTYLPTGNCSKYCPVCAPVMKKKIMKKNVHDWNVRKGIFKGTGSGCTTGVGEKNHMYVHGKCVFDRWARERLLSLGHCERCNTPLIRSERGSWAGHHKDHNPYNNTIENLELLCRKCHAIEHECWKAFEGVTTIPKGSRTDNSSEAPSPAVAGDDIVCSV